MRHFLLLVRVGLIVLIGLPGCGYQFGVEGNGPTIGGERVVKTEGPPVLLAMDPLQNPMSSISWPRSLMVRELLNRQDSPREPFKE